MWLLKFHFAFSVMCLLTFVGFKHVFGKVIKDNGWLEESKRKFAFLSYWIFFIPFLNILVLFCLFLMIASKKDELEKKLEELKNREK